MLEKNGGERFIETRLETIGEYDDSYKKWVSEILTVFHEQKIIDEIPDYDQHDELPVVETVVVFDSKRKIDPFTEKYRCQNPYAFVA